MQLYSKLILNYNGKTHLKILGCIILSLSTIVLAFLTGEAVIRLFYPLISNYDLEMWRYAAHGKILIDDSRQYHKHKPGAYFRELYGVEVKINSKGLRDYEYSYVSPKDCYRILVLGDSITFGWGVPLEKTYSKCLEKNLNETGRGIRYQVINAGVANYRLIDEVAFLKEEGFKYNPDIIILGYFINDVEISPKVRFFHLKKHLYLYGFLWSRINAIITKLNTKRNFVNYYNSLYIEGTETKENFEKYIMELKLIIKNRKIPLLVILIPDLHNLKNYPFKQIHEYVASLFQDNENSEVIDLIHYFDKDADPSIYWVSREDPHHNAKAHGIIAQAIYPKVAKLISKGAKYEER